MTRNDNTSSFILIFLKYALFNCNQHLFSYASNNPGNRMYFEVDAPTPSAPVDPIEEEEVLCCRLTNHVGYADSFPEAEEHSGIDGYW